MKTSYILAALLLTIITIGGASAVLNESNAAYWTADNTAADATGKGNTATLQLGTTYTASGKINQSFDLDGTNDYIDLPSTLIANSGATGSFTLAGWIYKDTSATNEYVWWWAVGAGTEPRSRMDIATNNTYHLELKNGAGTEYNLYSTATIGSGHWAYITLTFNGATEVATWYINATSQGSVTTSGITWAATSDFELGRLWSGTNTFNGRMDEWGFWNRTLNQTEITELYNLGVGCQANYTSCGPAAPVANLSITATNAYTSAAISTFNASVQWNGTTTAYTTTTGQINTTKPVNSTLPANVTINASGLYFTYTITNFPNSTLAASVTPWANITATDYYDGSAISSFTATLNGTPYTTTTGSVKIPAQTSYNTTISATNYFNTTLTNAAATITQTARPFQAQITFVASEIVSGVSVTPFTATEQGGDNSNGTNPVLYLKAGNYNVTFNKTGWYNAVFPIVVTALQNNTQNLSGVYQYLLNISLRNQYTNATATTYTLNATSGLYSYNTITSTTNGTVTLPWSNDSNINFTTTGAGYARTSTLYNLSTPGLINITLYTYTNNSIRINIYNESTGNIFNGTTVTINTNGNSNSYTNTTTNGTFYIDNLPDGTYNLMFSATGYSTRMYYVTVASSSTQQLNAYLTTSVSTTTLHLSGADGPGVGQPVSGAITTFETFVNGSYTVVSSLLSDITGAVGPFNYVTTSPYRITITATGYITKQFVLNPIQTNSYDILLTSVTSFTNAQDYFGVSIVFTPSNYFNNVQNNFTFITSSPTGRFTAYNYTIVYPSGSATNNGSNAYGSTLTSNFNITGATNTDTVTLNYCYNTAVTGQRCFSRTYPVLGTYTTTYTLSNIATSNTGMGDLEKIGIATVGTGILVGAATIAVGPIGAGVVWLVSMGFFYKILSFSIWLLLIPAFVGFIIIAFGSRNQ